MLPTDHALYIHIYKFLFACESLKFKSCMRPSCVCSYIYMLESRWLFIHGTLFCQTNYNCLIHIMCGRPAQLFRCLQHYCRQNKLCSCTIIYVREWQEMCKTIQYQLVAMMLLPFFSICTSQHCSTDIHFHNEFLLIPYMPAPTQRPTYLCPRYTSTKRSCIIIKQ